MKKQSSCSNAPATIKGYLPIRIHLPPPLSNNNTATSSNQSFTSFIYVKEHIPKVTKSSSLPSASSAESATLFIANTPANGPIRTDLFLKGLFEQYGDVVRVTVAHNPRKGTSSSEQQGEVELFREAALASCCTEGGGVVGWNAISHAVDEKSTRRDGKFAHVVFSSGKEMRRVVKAIKRDVAEEDGMFAMKLDHDTIERLSMETAKAKQRDIDDQQNDNHNDDESSNEDEDETTTTTPPTILLTGIQAIYALSLQNSTRHIPRTHLLTLCNSAMSTFEFSEAESLRRAKLAAEQPDEDGFITVTHVGSSSKVAAPSFTAAFEENVHERRGGKRIRSRKRKNNVSGDERNRSGAGEFTDFYRFQRRDEKKKEVQDLKARFEEDLEKVRKMKEERAFRPF